MNKSQIQCLIKHHTMKIYWDSRGMAPCIINFSTRYSWVVSYMPWPL